MADFWGSTSFCQVLLALSLHYRATLGQIQFNFLIASTRSSITPIYYFALFFIGDTEACLLDAQHRAANLASEVSKKDANIEALVKDSRSKAESAVQAQNVINFLILITIGQKI